MIRTHNTDSGFPSEAGSAADASASNRGSGGRECPGGSRAQSACDGRAEGKRRRAGPPSTGSPQAAAQRVREGAPLPTSRSKVPVA
eukprot:6587122-Pyramimonas_sp.AAC.1